MKYNYSETELKMIETISPSSLRLTTEAVCPSVVFEMMAIQCFIENKTGPAVDALRRAIKASRNCYPYRESPEYEELIKF